MFDFSDAKETKSSPVPNGTYNVELVKAEDAVSKQGNKMFKLEFTITDGDSSGRRLWTQFVYGGPSASTKVVEITASKIKEMCRNMGTEPKFADIQSLVGKKCAVVVKVRSDETYGDKSEISYFKPTQAAKVDSKEKLPF